MSDASESPKGYCLPKLVISHAVYLYHRLSISYRDVQELLFERGIDVSHETVRTLCVKFVPDLAEALQQRKPKCGRAWHLDEMRIVLGGVAHWLCRAINERGEVLDVLLQKTRCKEVASRCLQRLLDEQGISEQIVTDGLRSYGDGSCFHVYRPAGSGLRRGRPKGEAHDYLVKAEAVPERIRALVRSRRPASSFFGLFKDGFALSSAEIVGLRSFFVSRHKPLEQASSTPEPFSPVTVSKVTPLEPVRVQSTRHYKHCGGS